MKKKTTMIKKKTIPLVTFADISKLNVGDSGVVDLGKPGEDSSIYKGGKMTITRMEDVTWLKDDNK